MRSLKAILALGVYLKHQAMYSGGQYTIQILNLRRDVNYLSANHPKPQSTKSCHWYDPIPISMIALLMTLDFPVLCQNHATILKGFSKGSSGWRSRIRGIARGAHYVRS